MKTHLILLAITLIAVPALTSLQAQPVVKAKIQEMMAMAKELPALLELLKGHDEAFKNHDLDGVLATFADHDRVTVLGTGPGEHWVGKEEIKYAYEKFFEGFDKGKQKYEYGFRKGNVNGDTAWITTAGKITITSGEITREFGACLSLVMEKQNGQWKIAMFHFSNPTGPAQGFETPAKE